MPTFSLQESNSEDTVYETIPDGSILTAEVVQVDERDSFFWEDPDDHSKGKQRELAFKFRIVEDGEFYNRVVWGSVPTWFTDHPRCKLRLWTQEILQTDSLPSGFTLNTDVLEGEQVKVLVSTYPRKTDAEGEQTGNKVTDLLRVSGNVQFADDAF